MDFIAGGHLPLLVFLEHSTALSTWMSRGFSSAEAALNSSASAETKDVRRMVCNVWFVACRRDASDSNGL
jgi:hypothetical protein